MEKIYNKYPILSGILVGQGILVGFILFEYLLVSTGISECGIVVDSCIRIIVGILALIVLKKIYKNELGKLFFTRLPKYTWIYCIPFGLCLLAYLLHVPIAESLTLSYVGGFALSCLQQIGTGFFEEASSRGILMSGMLQKWKASIKGRIGMVFLSGLLFGAAHILNFLFGNDLDFCLWNSLCASAFGVFVASIYLYSGNLLFCMILHTVWDIVIRVPQYFCENVSGEILKFLYVSCDIIELGVFPIIAIVICIMLCKSELAEDTQQISEVTHE